MISGVHDPGGFQRVPGRDEGRLAQAQMAVEIRDQLIMTSAPIVFANSRGYGEIF